MFILRFLPKPNASDAQWIEPATGCQHTAPYRFHGSVAMVETTKKDGQMHLLSICRRETATILSASPVGGGTRMSGELEVGAGGGGEQIRAPDRRRRVERTGER
ncbi:uncharacterized protein SPSK_08168 [Sporothrix schenckii 1099-18]|uniref:Uncharacterized protein n=1 Tax=Sporothrix schenckii 1099-18 TaxID=1397361 RepID=A0A0F2MI56_SPOSC|nr:uncharacterized protein SPSK_08168 [Sporothrix schenckii 1099-18]KJR87861.1 hypothetical protein SPSK_08168 [Sporothrix schenckii 1099-18]